MRPPPTKAGAPLGSATKGRPLLGRKRTQASGNRAASLVRTPTTSVPRSVATCRYTAAGTVMRTRAGRTGPRRSSATPVLAEAGTAVAERAGRAGRAAAAAEARGGGGAAVAEGAGGAVRAAA